MVSRTLLGGTWPIRKIRHPCGAQRSVRFHAEGRGLLWLWAAGPGAQKAL